MSCDPNWTDLAGAWTAGPAETPDAAPDPGLVRRLRRRALAGRINFVFECLLCLAAFAVAGWLGTGGAGPGKLGLAIATAVFAGFALAMTVWARGGPPPALDATPADALRLALHQARAGLRWARAGVWVSVAALIFLAVNLAPDALREGGPPAGPLLAAGAAAMVVSAWLYHRHGARCRRRIASHEAALKDLAD